MVRRIDLGFVQVARHGRARFEGVAVGQLDLEFLVRGVYIFFHRKRRANLVKGIVEDIAEAVRAGYRDRARNRVHYCGYIKSGNHKNSGRSTRDGQAGSVALSGGGFLFRVQQGLDLFDFVA